MDDSRLPKQICKYLSVKKSTLNWMQEVKKEFKKAI